jgi:transmembrane sensor
MPIQRRNMDIKLLHYLLGEGCSEEERAEVERWITRNKKNRAYFEQVKKLWEEKRFIESLKAIDVDRIRKGLQEKIDQSNLMKDDLPVFHGTGRWLGRVAAVAAILLLSSTGLFMLKIRPGNSIQQVSSITNTTEVLLTDGTVIVLNKGSILRYPEKLNRRKREVTLSGEAFFDVASRKNVPFIVHTGNAVVRVVGTSFNIKEDEGQVVLSVISGEVLFYRLGREDQAIGLMPGQTAVYHSATGAIDRSTFTSPNFLFWKTATLTFSDEPVEKVFQELEEYYHTIIVIADNEILQDRVTTSCEGQQLQQILEELSFLHDLYYSRINDTIYVHKKPK